MESDDLSKHVCMPHVFQCPACTRNCGEAEPAVGLKGPKKEFITVKKE